MPGQIGNRGGGRPGYGLSELTRQVKVKAFAQWLKKFESAEEKTKDLMVMHIINKILPQTLEGTGDKGEFIFKIAQEILNQHEITSDTISGSIGQNEIQSNLLRETVGKDNGSDRGDQGMARTEGEQGLLCSPDVSTGEGYSVESTEEGNTGSGDTNKREPVGDASAQLSGI